MENPKHVYLNGRSYPSLGRFGRRVSKGELLCAKNESTVLLGIPDRGPN